MNKRGHSYLLPLALVLLVNAGCAWFSGDSRERPSSATPKAARLVEEGRYYEAIRLWQEAPPGSDTDQKVKETEKLLAADIDGRVKQMNSLYKRGRLAEAAKTLLALLEVDPRRRDELSQKYQGIRADYEGRKAEYRKLIDSEKATGDLAGAHEMLVKLTYIDPYDPAAQEELAQVERSWRADLDAAMAEAARHWNAGSFEEARDAYDKIARRWPGYPVAKNYLDQLRLNDAPALARTEKAEQTKLAAAVQGLLTQAEKCQTGGDYRCAIEKLNAALAEDPASQTALEKKDALLRELTPTVEDLYKKGLEYYRGEEIARAADQWRLVLLIDPAHEKARRDLQRAESVLQKLKKVQPRTGTRSDPADGDAGDSTRKAGS